MDNAIELATEIIIRFEGLKLMAYQDSAQIWTIGYGHTKDVYKGMSITKEQAKEFLRIDLADSSKRLSKVKIGLTDNEKACLLSLGYNLTLKSYNKLVDLLNASKEVFKLQMLRYCKDVEGNYLKGLKIRRICERLLFENKKWINFADWAQQKETTVQIILEREKELFNL